MIIKKNSKFENKNILVIFFHQKFHLIDTWSNNNFLIYLIIRKRK
jgi:hypothetical protein